ncbi:MAG: SUMF1/EgtB/PvdO family nonheme iron enzyme, partial [Planctomycetales bacterium]|nr:SUMF1/EgtB/PvdO family nonheme iron enzyme [Planctomycetales bacterium]
ANKFRNTQARYFLPSADEWYKAAFFDPVSDKFFDFPNGSNTAPLPVASGTVSNTAVYEQTGPADVTLAGGANPFGTVAQAGNVWEWDETASDLINDGIQELRGLRGFAWLTISGNTLDLSSSFRNQSSPQNGIGDVGFRVASVALPEPTTIYLASMGVILLAGRMGGPIANQLRP